MRRSRVLVAGIALVLAAAPRAAWGQMGVTFHAAADTALGVVPGDTAEVPLLFYTFYAMDRGQFTIHFDPTKLDIVGAIPVELSTLTVTPVGPGAVRVHGSGFAYAGYTLFRLQVVLRSGVTDGAYLWASPDTVHVTVSPSNQALQYTSGIGRICHATSKWGDVDGNVRVDSRDALITLSAAVGLPTGGFQTVLGDVDADGIVGSRDALMMLSRSIGLTISASNRVGVAIVDACPGLTAPSESMVFRRWPAGTGPVGQLMYLAAGSTTPTLVTSDSVSKLGSPRLAADDSTIGYHCYDAVSFSRVCRIQRSGAGAAVVTTTSFETVEWSPDGAELLFGRSSELLRIPAGGGTEVPVTSGGTASGSQSWNKDGVQIAYMVRCPGTGCQNIGTINADGTSPTLVPITGVVANAFREVRWSPVGDSLAFKSMSEQGIFVVAGAGGVAQRAVALTGITAANPYGYFTTLMDWGPPGIAFPIQGAGTSNGLWLVDGGGVLRRLTIGDDDAPSFRRTP